MPHWIYLKPLYLKKQSREHPWVFALYEEFSFERSDKGSVKIFLFRNQDRTVFGMKKLSDIKNFREIRRLANRVVLEPAFRESLVTTDPVITELWKRH